MTNPLEALKIDYWYKAILVISSAALIMSLTVPMQGIANSSVQLFSLGGIFLGIGEWINHPLQVKVGGGFTISGYPRNNSIIGVCFVLFGLSLVGYGVYSVIR
ncbi:hypothetical protein SAMN05216206_3544 [Pseudomonas guineae]|uniref:Uncharacterized protein n=1 Tax=Pseudomonas guineae TaxID=425504 RepID=A0A1I3P0Z3_9PSED|nr:hypothetical protein SAMN05216206_3544 [Pseudomonas guineae]